MHRTHRNPSAVQHLIPSVNFLNTPSNISKLFRLKSITLQRETLLFHEELAQAKNTLLDWIYCNLADAHLGMTVKVCVSREF